MLTWEPDGTPRSQHGNLQGLQSCYRFRWHSDFSQVLSCEPFSTRAFYKFLAAHQRCTRRLSCGLAYGFAPIRGILLLAMEDGCRNTDFDGGFDCVDFIRDSASCSSGIMPGNLAPMAGRMGMAGVLLIFEGLEISESNADL